MRTSKTTKNAYLAKLTENIQMRSVDVGKDLDGSRYIHNGLSRAVDR